MKRRKRIMVWLFSLVIGFSMLVPNNVFAITNEDNHVETVQTNLANDQLAKQNESGIYDIFYPKDNTKLELFKVRVLNRLLYKDEEIDVSEIDISPYEIQYTYGNSYLNGEYAARQIVRDNVLHSTVSTIGFPIFTYKDNGNVATVKYTYHPAWTDDFIKRVIAGYDEAISLINPNDTDFAKALKLHDWIVKNVSYGMSKTYSDFAVGALANRSAVCAGYAQCYQFLLSQVGVQGIYIAAKTTKEPHAWNLVKIDGHYFHVDCTWDRGLGANPNVNHTYFMLNDEEFNADGAHTEDWKDPSKGYPTNNQCSIENKFYKDYKVMATDEQIAANPIKIKHVYDDSTTYNTSSSEHWRTCVAGVEVHEKHDGNPCSVCHYETVKVCDHTWINNHDDSNHWEECSKCKEIRNKEKHTPNGTWEKDDNSHWVTCTKCSDVKLNKTNHTWSEEYDATYHWKQCSICGYETTKVKHNGNPCSECNYESSHVWKENHNDTKHWQECSICNTKQNEENHTAKAGWLNDSNNHWQVCSKCSDVKMNNASHTWIHKHDEKSHWNECNVCGYIANKEDHVANSTYEKDANNHWNVCTKCADIKMNIKAHTFVQKNDGTYHWKQCSICGYETTKAKHDGNPCSECKYESKHIWVDKHDDSKHWQECSICHTKQNEENHIEKASWLNDVNNHWQVCSKCLDVKMNIQAHTFVQKNDGTYHWKQCSICGYETTKAKHGGNPCSECKYESKHIWMDKHDDSKHWQECSICHTKQNEENHKTKVGWLNDSNNHWQVCSKCLDVKMNIQAHTFVQKNDGTYHWEQCSTCGYEINRVNIEISVTDILLNTTSKTIQKGKTYTLVPTIAPTNATNKKVTYTTSNSKVATVTTNGTIKAINGGTAVITVKTSNKKTATCKVTVPYTVKYNLNGGTNNKSNPTSYYGKKITLQNPARKGYSFAGWYSDSKYKTKVTSFSSGNKVLYAKWNKVTVSKAKTPTLTNIATRKMKVSYGATSGVKGYQIQYATNSKFTGSKTKTTTARSYTLTSLTKGKRYYVRVRGHKTDSTGNKVYGSWSAVKSIKIGK